LSAVESVLISTYLEQHHVDQIRSSFPSLHVLYEPDLLPPPRYVGDHSGRPRELDSAGQAHWEHLLGVADVSFDFDWQAPQQLSQRAPRLRWVQATSAGIGGFMRRTGLHDANLTVTTAAGVHAVPLAEFALAGALHFSKGFDDLRARAEARSWQRYTGELLADRSITVVGLGEVGRQVVAHFAGIGASVTGVGRQGASYDVPGATQLRGTDELAQILPTTDVLILCCALTPETEGLIGAEQLAMLPANAVLVNIARGQVVDERSLILALESGRLRGACLDVFAHEPLPADSPLWTMASVIVSPHSASTVDGENALLTSLFVDNLTRLLEGRPLRNLYDRQKGY
jgi:phosphoglycerate dehydrogenase-like enzyme